MVGKVKAKASFLLLVLAGLLPAQEVSRGGTGSSGGSGGPAAFSTIVPGTFTGGALIIGTDGSLTTSGAGAITATGLTGAATGSSLALTGALTAGSGGGATGAVDLSGAVSGTVTITPQPAAGTYNFNLPTSAGESGQPLLSAGGGANAMTFGTLGVAGGGTGATSLTGLLKGNGASAFTAAVAGADYVGGQGSLTTAGAIPFVGSTNGVLIDYADFTFSGAGGLLNVPAKLVVAVNISGGVASLQNSSSSQYTAVDLLDNTATLQGFFGWGNSGSAAPSAFYFGTANNNPIYVETNNTKRWTFNGSGHLLAFTDNTFDIGASGATRPRTGYFGTSLVSPAVNATTKFQLNGTDGVTASGGSCTVTAISGGIITAATCI